MSDKELNRINVIQAVSEKRLRQRDAASQLNLTERQIQRLVNQYRELGLSGLVHTQRGKQGNHCFPDAFKQRVMALLHQNYSDFGPTLATEKSHEKHGKHLAFYSDKHGVFRVNPPNSTTTGTTQFGRVLHDIGVELIGANSPQAKGRVKRANKTLQDHLIKDMRLESISSIEEANAWLEGFVSDFNQRFARVPIYPKNLHRPVTEHRKEIDDIFSWQETRKLTKELTFCYDKMIYLVEPTEENSCLAGENTQVYDYLDETLAFKYGHRSLRYQIFDKLDCIN